MPPPRHLSRAGLSVWDHAANRDVFIGLIRSAVTDEHAATLLREFAVREIFSRVAIALGTQDAELRANLVFSQIFGLAVARYILRIEPLVSTPANRSPPRSDQPSSATSPATSATHPPPGLGARLGTAATSTAREARLWRSSRQ